MAAPALRPREMVYRKAEDWVLAMDGRGEQIVASREHVPCLHIHIGN